MDWNKYKTVDSSTQRMWPEKDQMLTEGDFIEGRYVSKKENVGANNSTIYILDVDGEQVGVWGTSVLDTKFAQIAVGKMVAIEYQGKKQSEKRKGSSYHDFKVGVGIDVVGDDDPFSE